MLLFLLIVVVESSDGMCFLDSEVLMLLFGCSFVVLPDGRFKMRSSCSWHRQSMSKLALCTGVMVTAAGQAARTGGVDVVQ